MWSIGLVKNTVKISEECVKELFEAQGCDEIWYDEEDVSFDGKLYFDCDHMEHMDYLGREEIQNVLKKHKVEGIVLFCSADGDNSGTFWGYEFDGAGGLVSHYADLEDENVFRKIFPGLTI